MASTLTVDTIVGATTATSVKLPAGAVLNCVQFVYPTYQGITANSYAATGITMNITPKYTSSKVLVLISAGGCGVSGANNGEAAASLVRTIGGSATTIETFERFVFSSAADGNANHISISAFLSFLDSPNTTSATTYTLHARTSAGTLRFNDHQVSGNASSQITLLEISG